MNSGEWVKAFRLACEAARTNRKIAGIRAIMESDNISIADMVNSINGLEGNHLFLYETETTVDAYLSEPVTFRMNEFSISQVHKDDLMKDVKKLIIFDIPNNKMIAYYDFEEEREAQEEATPEDERVEAPSTFEGVNPPAMSFGEVINIDKEAEEIRPNLSALAAADPRIFGKLVTITELKNCLIEDQLLSQSISDAFKKINTLTSLHKLLSLMIETRATSANFSMNAVMIIHTLKGLVDDLLDPSKEMDLTKLRV